MKSEDIHSTFIINIKSQGTRLFLIVNLHLINFDKDKMMNKTVYAWVSSTDTRLRKITTININRSILLLLHFTNTP